MYVEEFLSHHGVKGMKWGKRKTRGTKEAPSSDAKKALDLRARAKRSKSKALTNEELKTAIERMRLEQEFKRLSVNERSAVQRWIGSTLLNVGQQQIGQPIATAAAKKLTKVVVKKVATGGLA